MASKIIVIGDVNGQLSDVFGKLTKLHAKNSFAFAIITGSLFADPQSSTEDQTKELHQLLQGNTQVPFPTYFALGKRPLPPAVIERLSASDGELCPNLFVLGRKVSMKTSDGFKLVAIGGSHVSGDDEIMNEYDASYTDKHVEAAEDFKNADILITSDWPVNIRDGSKVAYVGESPTTIKSIARLCIALKPRYHLSASSAFFEREPFFFSGPRPDSVTRFISLAPFNNSQKQKAMYAFSLEPSAGPLDRLPDGCTASPFIQMRSDGQKRKFNSEIESSNGFRFANSHDGSYEDRDRDHRSRKRRRQPRAEPAECFFCLAGDNVGTHMITSIGEDVYMTIAKGPLTTRENFPGLNHPLHMLIIPLQHEATFGNIPLESRKATLAEMHRYREALHNMISVKSTKGDDGEAQLGSVTWEISRNSGVHLHWQFLPVAVKLIQDGLIEAAFDVEAENLRYPNFAKKESEIAEALEGDHFKLMIWTESMQKEMVLPLGAEYRFDLQFGRRVLGKLMGLEKRTHWKDCVQTEAEEVTDATTFKELFESYDPSEPAAEEENEVL